MTWLVIRKLFLGVIVMSVGSLVVIAHLTHFLTIQKITCSITTDAHETQACPDDVQAEWQKLVGKSIFVSDIGTTGNRMTTLLPSLTQFSYHKKLPNEVIVSFKTQPLVYLLQVGSGDTTQIWPIDQAGLVSDADVHTATAPIITVAPNVLPDLHLHQAIDHSLHTHLAGMLQFLQSQPLEYQQIVILSKDELALELKDGKRVLMRTSDVEKELQQAQYVLRTVDFASIHEPIKVIDARFKYPVLKT